MWALGVARAGQGRSKGSDAGVSLHVRLHVCLYVCVCTCIHVYVCIWVSERLHHGWEKNLSVGKGEKGGEVLALASARPSLLGLEFALSCSLFVCVSVFLHESISIWVSVGTSLSLCGSQSLSFPSVWLSLFCSGSSRLPPPLLPAPSPLSL